MKDDGNAFWAVIYDIGGLIAVTVVACALMLASLLAIIWIANLLGFGPDYFSQS